MVLDDGVQLWINTIRIILGQEKVISKLPELSEAANMFQLPFKETSESGLFRRLLDVDEDIGPFIEEAFDLLDGAVFAASESAIHEVLDGVHCALADVHGVPLADRMYQFTTTIDSLLKICSPGKLSQPL